MRQAGTQAPEAVGLRNRILDVASELTAELGWTAVTMTRLGDAVGMSRQTIYNEVGTKDQLAEALVMREFRAFLDVVDQQLCAGSDPIDSVRRATAAVLGLAATSPLLHAVVESAHGANTELLPLLTTNSQPMISAATAAIELRLAQRYPQLALTGAQLRAAVDTIVRLMFSHVLQPEASQRNGIGANHELAQSANLSATQCATEGTVERVVWVAQRLLGE